MRNHHLAACNRNSGGFPDALRRLCLLLLLATVPFVSRGSAYWMEVDGSGKTGEPVEIRVYYGSVTPEGGRQPQPGAELVLTGAFSVRVADCSGQLTRVILHQQKDCWSGSFTPVKKGSYRIIGLNDTHPVIDRSGTGGKNVKPVDYICAVYRADDDRLFNGPLQWLDIIAGQQGKQVTVSVYRNGLPAEPGTVLRLFNPDSRDSVLIVGAGGKAVFTAEQKGWYTIREDWTDQQPGVYRGIPYTGVRHRCNYFLRAE